MTGWWRLPRSGGLRRKALWWSLDQRGGLTFGGEKRAEILRREWDLRHARHLSTHRVALLAAPRHGGVRDRREPCLDEARSACIQKYWKETTGEVRGERKGLCACVCVREKERERVGEREREREMPQEKERARPRGWVAWESVVTLGRLVRAQRAHVNMASTCIGRYSSERERNAR